MDYQALAQLIPKKTQEWSSSDVQIWLQHINFDGFSSLFNSHKINGNSLVRINSKTLSTMGIKSNIIQKKFMRWIQQGLKKFDQYLFLQSANKENMGCLMNRRKTQRQTQNTCKRNNKKDPQDFINKSNIQMKITNYQGPQNVYYIANQNGIKIGRNSKNQLQSLQVSVADVHAEVLYKQNKFFIQDLGSQTGTFIKIQHKMSLNIGCLIQMGSYLMKVESINIQLKKLHLKCVNITNISLVMDIEVDLNNQNYFSFGRRNINNFWQDDQHLSGTHAKIYFLNDQFLIQDMGSTNGTWLRLSLMNQVSSIYPLSDRTIFKIGNTITYICHQKLDKVQKMQIQQNIHICQGCSTNERNIVFLPCKHNLVCSDCSMQYQFCPSCNHRIEHKIQMFI